MRRSTYEQWLAETENAQRANGAEIRRLTDELNRQHDLADHMVSRVAVVADCLQGHKINRKDAATRLYTIISRLGNLIK